MTGLYTIDGTDMYTAYGFIPLKGCSDDILRPRKAKDRYSNDWAEENGMDWDLSSPVKYEDREITLKGIIVASSESDFWTKWSALKTKFTNSGTFTLVCNEFGSNATVKAFYKDTPKCERYTKIKNTDKVVVEVEILIQESQQAI